MKWPVPLVFCLSAVAQTPGQNGLRVSGGTVFLVEQPQSAIFTDRQLAGPYGKDTTDGSGTRIIVWVPWGSAPPGQAAPRADFETWVEGVDRQYAESITTGSQAERQTEKVVIQRWVRDNFRHLYIRYSVTLEMLQGDGNGAGIYRATFGDSSVAIPNGLGADWKTIAPPEYPVALYISQASGQRLIDYIHLGREAPVMRKDPPRDVYTDAPEFDISQPKFRLNGIEQVLTAPSDPSHGASLWIYVPDQGRFNLSFKPAPDFELAGEAWGNSLIFTTDRNLLRLEGAERIAAAGSAPYRIYVRKDTARLPEEDRSRVALGVTP
jgi:hypothetical protein